MMAALTQRLMVMAGGTGGHVMPAMAVADVLKAQGWSIVWLATEGGMENRLIADKGYDVATIQMRGVRGKGILSWLSLPFKLLYACWQSYLALKKYRPAVVLGMGGFAAFPGGLMARLRQKPLVIHEQNSIAGLSNRVLAHIATRVLAAFPSAFSAAELVGNPVRDEITAVPNPEQRYSGRTGPLRLLVFGGSLGASIFNEVLPQALAMIPLSERPQVIHQAGTKHIQQLKANYDEAGVESECHEFIHDMAKMYAWCDLVICRAGALTVAEISVAGVASILIPFPYAVDNHQTHNARYLSENGAAVLVPQDQMTPQALKKMLCEFERVRLQSMAEKARIMGRSGAAQAVADVCKEVAV